MRAEPIRGEALRYTVHSETVGDETHVVDLTENDGNGACSCRDFETRRGPNYHRNGKVIVEYGRDDKGKVIKEATRCKHLNAAFLQFATDVAKEHGTVKRAQPVTMKERADGLPF